jgi:hypothetical protein
MAGTYAPTITTFADPLLTADSVNDTSYDEIVESLAANVYVCDSVDIQTNSASQLNEKVYVNEYDSDGSRKTHVIVPDTDPYQFQTSIKLKFEGSGIILNGRTSFGVDLLANSTTQLDFNSAQFDPSDVKEVEKAQESGESKELVKDSLQNSLTKKDLKQVGETFDYDFLNRSGLYEDAYTKLEEGQSKTLNNLFEGFVDEL